jgi:hypothetical protein
MIGRAFASGRPVAPLPRRGTDAGGAPLAATKTMEANWQGWATAVSGRLKMPGPQWHSRIPAPFTLTGRSLRRPHAR